MIKAVMYKPAKTAMQSGRGKAQQWVLEYETPTARLPESLMGWQESGDTLNQVRLKFDTLDQAVERAEKEGWSYTVKAEKSKRIRPRNYVDNFKYIPPEEESV